MRRRGPGLSVVQLCWLVSILLKHCSSFSTSTVFDRRRRTLFVSRGFHPLSERPSQTVLHGWVQREDDGEWEWEEEGDHQGSAVLTTTSPSLTANGSSLDIDASATPRLPSGQYKPKQSLGQNYLRDGNTVAKIVRTFHDDVVQARMEETSTESPLIVELGPGAGALTDKLVETYGTGGFQCIEIDERSVQILRNKHPDLVVHHQDVLQVDYAALLREQSATQPLAVIGNLPYYITSQILFCLADASHVGAVDMATVTMQWEVAQRMVARPGTKDYGILSVVFALYSVTKPVCHFKIPPTVFYPKPKVDSALVGLHFAGPELLRRRLRGVLPSQLRQVVTTAFQQRRKTLRNSLKRLMQQQGVEVPPFTPTNKREKHNVDSTPESVGQTAVSSGDDDFVSTQELPADWTSKRPEELTAGQFVELTRLLFGPVDGTAEHPADLGAKVWRKHKHGSS